jgi:hypothetical protein
VRPPPATEGAIHGDVALHRYYGALAERRLVSAEAGSQRQLEELVVRGQELVLDRRFDEAALVLFEACESPRFTDFEGSDDASHAEYLLGGALLELGAHRTGRALPPAHPAPRRRRAVLRPRVPACGGRGAARQRAPERAREPRGGRRGGPLGGLAQRAPLPPRPRALRRERSAGGRRALHERRPAQPLLRERAVPTRRDRHARRAAARGRAALLLDRDHARHRPLHVLPSIAATSTCAT